MNSSAKEKKEGGKSRAFFEVMAGGREKSKRSEIRSLHLENITLNHQSIANQKASEKAVNELLYSLSKPALDALVWDIFNNPKWTPEERLTVGNRVIAVQKERLAFDTPKRAITFVNRIREFFNMTW